jgi:hypothetical protein
MEFGLVSKLQFHDHQNSRIRQDQIPILNSLCEYRHWNIPLGRDWLPGGAFFGSLRLCAAEPGSHRAMQPCPWLFSLVSFGSLWYTVAAFSEPLWSSYLDACSLICSLTMVCLPHTSLQVLLPPLVTVRQWLGAAIMSLLATGNSRSRRVRRAVSPLTTGSRQRRWVSRLAPCSVDLGDNC